MPGALRGQSAAGRETAVSVERGAPMGGQNNVAGRGMRLTAQCLRERVVGLDRATGHFKR